MLKATIAKWVAACESYKNGDYNAAITSFKALDPNSKILFNVGLSYARMNQHSEAVRTYSQAIQADPWLAIAYFARGCSFHQMGDSKSAAADMDDAIDRLRGHENIDYKQLGLDFQLLLCEISVNKYIAGQQNDSLLRDARSCKLFRGGDRNLLDDKCDALLKGSRNVTMFTVEQLFSPPTIGKGGGSKGGDAKPADAKPPDSGRSGGSGARTEEKKDSNTAKPSDTNKAPSSSEERPKETTIKRGEDDRTRSILAANNNNNNNNNNNDNDNNNNNNRRGAPSSLPSRETPSRETPSLQSRTPSSLPSRETPSLPSRDSRAAPAVPSREARESKALPAVPGKTSAASGARPLTIGDGSTDMMTLRCFYQDRRLVQIPRQGPTLELLRERISQKFGKSGLNIRYKTSNGSSSPLNTQKDLMSAIEDGMQELYLGSDGEINEFESKTQNPSRSNTKDDSASRPTTTSSASSTPKYGSGSSSSIPNPFLKPSTTATTSTTTTTSSTITATAKPSTYGSKVNSDSKQSSAARAGGTSYSNTNNDSRGYNSSASSVSARKDSSNGRSDSRSNNSNNSNSSNSSGRNGNDSNGGGSNDSVKMIGDWQVCYTDSGETYYYNPQTNESSWEPPSSQPSPPWMVCYTDQNEKYYYNPDTDLSVWDFPG